MRPYLAFGRGQLRLGVSWVRAGDPPWARRYRWVGLSWQ